MMTTREVAAYLRLKERKIYALVREERIPFTRVGGKLLFPRDLIDRWMADHTAGADRSGGARRPPIVAGSRDPLLDWAISESASGLALMAGGSEDGLERFARGEAVAAGLHMRDPETGEYNLPFIELRGVRGAVLIEWAKREQGLLLPKGNSRGIAGLADALAAKLVFARRQCGAGARMLLDQLVADAGVDPDRLRYAKDIATTGHEVGLAILDARADIGVATEAVAHQLHLDFVPLAVERFDLLISRRRYFESALQALFACARTKAFRAKADELGGYDIAGLGTVRWNAP
jgi:excisionase family DNA binding protein